ncbi:MAG TPA: NAD(P)/FAD-dependent oxidoreductase [Polyangiaceae bacterium]|nr:NAD(P)/FAD-dependent oxidoreductase [Polyangiaceae bacterium]
MSDFDVCIIGAGVVGLACAAELAAAGRSVVVLERHARPGQETSSRNSGVIHAGLYYPTGSLKAQLCVEGRALLYERCRKYGIGHRKTGKLLVATAPEEEPKLAAIQARGLANGAGELTQLSRSDVARLEPRVSAISALWSPESGIVDVHELMYSYQKQASDQGAVFVFQTEVVGIEASAQGFRVATRSAGAPGESAVLGSRILINAAGLFADRIAERAGLDVDALRYRYHWCKGDYFVLDAALRGLVQHLVYPAPVHAGLGIHITFDLGGRMTLGPDTEYVTELSYRVDPNKRAHFASAARRYLPELRDEQLSADYAGVRPKLQGPHDDFRDFVIEDACVHGIPALINLIGIESPGVTASLAVARRVRLLASLYF